MGTFWRDLVDRSWSEFLGLKKRAEDQKTHYAALDVGTEYVKALVFSIEEERGVVLGAGKQRQGYTHMQDGVVTDIKAVVGNCEQALQQAENMAGVLATHVVIGIAGELVKGTTETITIQRTHPMNKFSEQELDELIARVQQQALKRAQERLAIETGYPDVQVRIIHAAVVDVRIDGFRVTNPLGYQGTNVKLTIYNAFAPLLQLGALHSVATDLDVELLSVVAEPYAVARCLTSPETAEIGALFMDIGGGTTDVALVRNGGIEGTAMFAFGGRAYTKHLAIKLDVEMNEAEDLKLDYSQGRLSDKQGQRVKKILERDAGVWMEGVELLLDELAAGEILPPHLYVCGGGSGLPEVAAQLRAFPWESRLPFSRPPRITFIKPRDVRGVVDQTGLMDTPQDITPMGLAYQAVEMYTQESVLDQALRRVRRTLKL